VKEITGYNSKVSDRLLPMLSKAFMDHLETHLPDEMKAANYRLEGSHGYLLVSKEKGRCRVELKLVQPIEAASGQGMDPARSIRNLTAEFLVDAYGFEIVKGPAVEIVLEPAGEGSPSN
jgi:hypothetical protein